PRLRASHPRRALTLEADMLAMADPHRNLHAEGFLTVFDEAVGVGLRHLYLNLALAAAVGLLQEQGQPLVDTLAPHLEAALPPPAGVGAVGVPATAEDALEKVAEVARVGLGEATAAEARRRLPAGGRLEAAVLAPGAEAPQLVVLGPLLRVL